MPTSEWTLDLPRIGSIIRARTKDTSGDEVGTFTADTRPTDDEATVLMNDAASDVASVVGANIPSSLWREAGYVAALDAACMIELTYFPEQVNNGGSPYNQLNAMYERRLKQLVQAVTDAESGDTPVETNRPVGSFPDPPFANQPGSLPVGYRTRW